MDCIPEVRAIRTNSAAAHHAHHQTWRATHLLTHPSGVRRPYVAWRSTPRLMWQVRTTPLLALVLALAVAAVAADVVGRPSFDDTGSTKGWTHGAESSGLEWAAVVAALAVSALDSRDFFRVPAQGW